jgi:TRAP-type mannitol/chloroaromatic compound transport system permease small subunit
MNALLALSRSIDKVTTRIGRGVAWLILAAVLVSATNAIVRKAFDTSSNAWLELQWWLYAIVFLFASPWTLSSNEHIRIDILNTRFHQRTRDIIDLVGHAFFLLPMAAILAVTSWPFFLRSAPSLADFQRVLDLYGSLPFHEWLGRLFSLGEQSSNAGGLPLWPAKMLIPFAFALLFIQGISELIKRVAIMRGLMAEPEPAGSFQTAATQDVYVEDGAAEREPDSRQHRDTNARD